MVVTEAMVAMSSCEARVLGGSGGQPGPKSLGWEFSPCYPYRYLNPTIDLWMSFSLNYVHVHIHSMRPNQPVPVWESHILAHVTHTSEVNPGHCPSRCWDDTGHLPHVLGTQLSKLVNVTVTPPGSKAGGIMGNCELFRSHCIF